MSKLTRILYWSGPSLLCLLLYWNGLTGWFQMDDFAWLSLRSRVTDFESFVRASFTPYAQGSIRPISERWFFMGLFSLFGLNALPVHLVVFTTQVFNLVILAVIVRRLTHSAFAGIAASMLWVLNANINLPMIWASAYNQILCSTVLLLALYLFVRFTETGSRKFYYWQCLIFLLGFGVLELVVVYPAIAACYALVRARKYFRYTLPLFAVSMLYSIIHRAVQPSARPSTYAMYFDWSMFKTFAIYCHWILGPHGNGILFFAAEAAIAAGLAAFIVVRWKKHDWLPLFFAAWFLITLAPYIPLRNHLSDYYLTVPAIGLAMLGGYGLACAAASTPAVRIIAVMLFAGYAIPSGYIAHKWTREFSNTSRRVQNFVERLASAHKRNPGKILLIKGIDSELFWAGFYDRPYRLLGLTDVFLTEDTERSIEPFPERSTAGYFLADSVAYEGIRNGSMVVYDASNDRMRNVTTLHAAVLGAKSERQLPRIIDVGAPMYASQLGEGWYPPDDKHRWMMKRASLKIGAPSGPGAKLKVSGFCPEAIFKNGPVTLTVTIDGHSYPASRIENAGSTFALEYPLPPGAEKRPSLNVTVEVNRTTRLWPDIRDLGVIFGRFEISQ